MKKILLILFLFLVLDSYADETFHFDKLEIISCKDKSGYYEGTRLNDKNDPHFGWSLGEFFVTGYTRHITNEDGSHTLLKTAGKQITLYYKLFQDINALNGDKTLSISTDKKGYDRYFGIEETNFGRGFLIISHTDPFGVKRKPILYSNFLSAKCSRNADTTVQLLEEGDYFIKLNYEIKKGSLHVPFTNKSLKSSWRNYYVCTVIKVRNGDCMVFPKDLGTGSDLGNYAVTQNGFFLDLARSRYLELTIKKEILQDDTLITDISMNSATNEEINYTDEGIYTISAYNPYTKASTTKKIYVGNNPLLIKHAKFEGRISFAEIIQQEKIEKEKMDKELLEQEKERQEKEKAEQEKMKKINRFSRKEHPPVFKKIKSE